MSSDLILEAAVCAAEAHSKQKRKTSEEPYVNHVLRVAKQARTAGLSDEAVAAALLHDSVEDTKMTYSDISKKFNSRVQFLVKLLTQWWSDHASAEVKASEKPKYYKALMQDQEAMAIKLLDRADNLQDMCRMLPKAKDWAIRYLYRSERELRAVAEACENDYARKQYAQAIESLRKKLVSIGERSVFSRNSVTS